MSRYQLHIDSDVLTEAKKRLHHTFDLFDTVTVSFSGGKDSLVVLELARQVAAERGRDFVDAFFLDPEFLPDSILETVDYYRRQPWVRLKWFTLPEATNRYILGNLKTIVLWGSERERWLRPKPSCGISLPAADPRAVCGLTGDEIDGEVAKHYKGKIAFLLGIRAAESIFRLRSILNKLNESYITNPLPGAPMACRVKPIYDWQENDVLKFIYENQLRYCSLYDAQHLVGDELRTDAPQHAEAAKHMTRIRQLEPRFYSQMIELFPDLQVQERYWQEFTPEELIREYGGSLDDVERYIRTKITDVHQQKIALNSLKNIRVRSKARPRAYPPERVIRYFINGGFHRELLPLRAD